MAFNRTLYRKTEEGVTAPPYSLSRTPGTEFAERLLAWYTKRPGPDGKPVMLIPPPLRSYRRGER
jgi:hypothetical protein